MKLKEVCVKLAGKGKECCKNKKLINCFTMLAISTIVSVVVTNVIGASIVKRTIDKDPKFIIQSLQKMEANEQKKQQENANKNAPMVAQQLINESKSIIGNKNGSKVVIEFFDYNCGHCKRQAVELQQLIEKNKDIKVILVDLPILSEQSLFAAQVGIYIALNNNNKLEAYYEMLMKKQADQNSIKEVLTKLGLPTNYLDKAKNDASVRKIIEMNYDAAKNVGLQGTPALIINGKFIGGMIPAKDIADML